MAPLIISIEGNIGSGKSTFVSYLQRTMKNVVFLQEPVDEWNDIKDKEDETILAKFYKNQEKYSFAFQMMAYISRLALLKKTVEENPDAVIITERCLDTDRQVFARMLYDQEKIEEVEYQIYLKWFHSFQKEYPITIHVYLKTSPKIAHERVLKRGRPGETIPLAYLSECHDYHEKWLCNYAQVNVNAKTTATGKTSTIFTIDANEDEGHMEEWGQSVNLLIQENKKSNGNVYSHYG